MTSAPIATPRRTARWPEKSNNRSMNARKGENRPVVRTESSESGNAELGALSDTAPTHRAVDRKASACHRRSILKRECVRDGENKLLRSPDGGGVAALGDFAVVRLGVVSVDLLRAVLLVLRAASAAFATRVDLSADDDSVADLDRLDCRSDLAGDTANFVARDERQFRLAPSASDRVYVRRADLRWCRKESARDSAFPR